MNKNESNSVQEALRPIASLSSKSEKALLRLTPGAWQHTMLQNNLHALAIATALMKRGGRHVAGFPREKLSAALRSMASMIGKTEQARAKFSPGTSHHSLQSNRLKALCIAESVIRKRMNNA